MRRAVLGFLAFLLVSGCGGSGSSGPECVATLLPGDLVITEIMGNPAGDDSGQEWFEVYNASAAAVDISGLHLIASKADATSEVFHAVVSGTRIEKGQYFVFGGMLPDLRPAYVNYGYGADLGGLRNDAGRIALKCGDVKVDEAIYGTMDSGVAQGLDGSKAPDYQANDDPTMLCNQTTPLGTTQFGTPGAQNDACPIVGPQTMCLDGTGVRPIVKPVAGDLVITEIMPNPSKVGDTAGEWFEVLAVNAIDLNGLQLGNTPGDVVVTLAANDCIHVEAGTYLVFAREDVPATNGGLPKVDFKFHFGLTNSGGSVFVGIDDQVLDQVTYATSFTGASTGLDPGHIDVTANDDPANWCKATAPYGAGDLGTPGAENPACPVPLPDGKCQDGATVRDIVVPAVGDLVLTEVMGDPSAVDDSAGEWFEVQTTKAVDLNGLELGTVAGTARTTYLAPTCLKVDAGRYLVFARNDDMDLNGGLPAVDFVFDFGLTNSGSGLYVGVKGTVLDSITLGAATAGTSRSLDPGFANPADNDDPMHFCAAPDTSVYGLGDHGTPGMVNPSCTP